MTSRTDIEKVIGRAVHCSDGFVLGRVGEAREGTFLCERRGFFPKTFAIPYSEIVAVTESQVDLQRASPTYMGPSWRSGEVLRPLGRPPAEGSSPTPGPPLPKKA